MSACLLVSYIHGVDSLIAKLKHPSLWVFAKVRLDYLINNFNWCLSFSDIGDYGIISGCGMPRF